jgi:hypothetical protein
MSNAANANPPDLRRWAAIMDTTTLETKIYCLSGRVVWSPDSTHVIINNHVSDDEVKPVLVDLTQQTQTTLDIHGLSVTDWVSP